MSKQEETAITRKRRGPKPTGLGTLIGVRLQPEILAWLDEERAKHKPAPSRPEMIRTILLQFKSRSDT